MSKPSTPSDNSSIDLTNEHVTTTTTLPQTNDTTITTSALQTNGTTAPVLQIKESKRKRPIEYIEDDILDVDQQIIKLKKSIYIYFFNIFYYFIYFFYSYYLEKKELEAELIEAKEELKAKRLRKKLKQYD
jgi:hypothetical protein